LATDEDRWRPGQACVTRVTLHNAKGKDFPVVFIEGAQEGNVPCWRYREGEGGLEERRVFYVGMTRAEERLYVSSVLNRDERRRNPSPFPARLPQDHVLREYHYR
jgi:DNA helicase-2/ATP-dependent DNA helicase PcrA